MDPKLEEVSRIGNMDALNQLLQRDSLLLDRLTIIPFPITNPVHIASLLGHADFVREILNQRPKLARDLNEQGLSPLHLASAKGHLLVVKELLKVDSKLCLIVDKDGLMPIHTAAIKGRIDVLRELSDACPDSMQSVTSHGDTILHLAVRSNCYEAIEFLVEKLNDGQLLNQKDEKGNTILHLAVARKQFHVTKFLLDKQGIDVNSMNQKSCTPLDVLLDSTCEYGDLILGEIIRAAGGKTSREVIHQSPAEIEPEARDNLATPQERHSSRIGRFSKYFRCFRFAHHARKRRNKQVAIEDTKNSSRTLIIVATLIATITFQVGLNPPGGFKQDGGSPSPSPKIGRNFYFLDQETVDGQATLDRRLAHFLALDMVGLFASLCIILLLLCLKPQKKGMVMKVLSSIMWVAVFSTAMAFTAAIPDIFPYSSEFTFQIFLRGWFCILTIATLWVCIRLLKWLLQKVWWLIKKDESREQDTHQKTFVHIAKRVLAIIGVIIVVLGILMWSNYEIYLVGWHRV